MSRKTKWKKLCGNEEEKLSLFTDVMLIYEEISKIFYFKSLFQINKWVQQSKKIQTTKISCISIYQQWMISKGTYKK